MSKTFKILLDAGHGAGRAHNRGGLHFNEGDNNYKYSLVLKRELEKIPNVKVDLIRTSIGQDPSVSARAAKGRGYDLFLSLHSNAAGASVRGTEIFDSVERPNKALAQKLVDAISKSFGHNNRGVKYKKNSSGGNWYGVLRGNKAKAVMIIEHGFHTNKTDSLYFRDNHAKLAKVTADVIRSHYGLSGTKEKVNMYYHRTHNNTHPRVKKLQEDLNLFGYGLVVDTNFGHATEKAVKDYQKKNGLKVNGIADTATLRHLMYAVRNLDKPKEEGKKDTSDELHRVQVGAYGDKKNAEKKLKELKKQGHEAIIKTEKKK